MTAIRLKNDTATLLHNAHATLGQVALRWSSGQDAARTLRDLEEAKRLIALAEDRLTAHCAD